VQLTIFATVMLMQATLSMVRLLRDQMLLGGGVPNSIKRLIHTLPPLSMDVLLLDFLVN
jgi:hypothetical protein